MLSLVIVVIRQFGSGDDSDITNAEAEKIVQSGGGVIVGLDFAERNNRHPGLIWSWGENHPITDPARCENCCAAQIRGGSSPSESFWESRDCSDGTNGLRAKFACQNKVTGEWRLSPQAGKFSTGNQKCRALGNDWRFAVRKTLLIILLITTGNHCDTDNRLLLVETKKRCRIMETTTAGSTKHGLLQAAPTWGRFGLHTSTIATLENGANTLLIPSVWPMDSRVMTILHAVLSRVEVVVGTDAVTVPAGRKVAA